MPGMKPTYVEQQRVDSQGSSKYNLTETQQWIVALGFLGKGMMDFRFFEDKTMTKRQVSKLVHEGDYVAEVEIELIYTDEGWSPYLSLDDAQKLDDVRKALRSGDLESATRLAPVFKLTPVAA